jgi:uncharacterized protein (DUF2267 family)
VTLAAHPGLETLPFIAGFVEPAGPPGASRDAGAPRREQAWRVLRAYLQMLRDELTIDEAAQLAAQLPVVLRGAFYEGFDPGHQPAKLRDRDEFLARLADRAQLAGPDEAEHAAEAAAHVLRRHVTEGEAGRPTSPGAARPAGAARGSGQARTPSGSPYRATMRS